MYCEVPTIPRVAYLVFAESSAAGQVEYLRLRLSVDHHSRRRQVPMNDSLLMRVFDCLGEVPKARWGSFTLSGPSFKSAASDSPATHSMTMESTLCCSPT